MLRALTRRGVVFALTLAFFPLALLAVISLRVEVTFLNPQFLVRHLEGASLARPLRDHITYQRLAKGADRAVGRDPEVDLPEARSELERALISEGVEVSAEIFSEDWILDQTTDLLDVLLPYLARRERGFEVRFEVSRRVRLATQVFAQHLPESRALKLAHAQAVERLTQRVVARHPKLPLGLEATPEVLQPLFTTLLPREWVATQLAQTIEQLIAYLVGEQEVFVLLLPLQERQGRLGALREVLLEANTSGFLLDHVVRPAVRQGVGKSLPLPWGLSLSEEEIVSGFAQVLDPAWVKAQKTALVDEGVRYLSGEQERFEVRVPLVERRRAAAQVLSALILERLRETVLTLPKCPSIEEYQAQLSQHDVALKCGFSGIDAIGTMIMVNLKLTDRLNHKLEAHLPDDWTYTDAQMRARLGARTWGWLQRGRRAMREGWSIDQRHLNEYLGERRSAQLNALRQTIRRGVSWDDSALRTLSRRVDEANPERLETLRGQLSRAWLLTRLCLPLAAVSLLSVLLFGATGVIDRLRLAATLIAALGLLLLLGGWIVSYTINDGIATVEGLLPETSFNQGFADMLAQMTHDFLTVLRWQALSMLIGGGALSIALRPRAVDGAPDASDAVTHDAPMTGAEGLDEAPPAPEEPAPTREAD